MTGRRLRVLACVAAAATATACSATTGPAPAPISSAPAAVQASLTAAEVGSAITRATQQASAVHVRGALNTDGARIKLDLQLNQDSAGGSVEKDGAVIPLVRLGDVTYLQVSESVVTMAGLSPTTKPGSLLKDKWVTSQSRLGSAMAADFKEFLAYRGFVDNTVGQLRSSTFTDSGTDTVNGTRVLVFRSPEGVVDVAASEPHYPVRIADPQHGTLDFTGWNQTVAVTAPPAKDLYSGPGA